MCHVRALYIVWHAYLLLCWHGRKLYDCPCPIDMHPVCILFVFFFSWIDLINSLVFTFFIGQIELFSHVPMLRNFVDHLKRKNFNVCAVYLLDSQVCRIFSLGHNFIILMTGYCLYWEFFFFSSSFLISVHDRCYQVH